MMLSKNDNLHRKRYTTYFPVKPLQFGLLIPINPIKTPPACDRKIPRLR
jgi:hypothetical protein